MTAGNVDVAKRQEAMRLCALASAEELSALVERLGGTETVSDLRRPERGLVMLQGRAGGEGAAFNLGEASVVRAAVSLSDGTLGFAYHLGRDAKKARHAAILDALRQRPGGADRVDGALEPVARRITAEDRLDAERTAATRVEFFTMTRGED
ncbi:MAG: phosphonate C-P lyase system protein PhnG [Mesorhizobium amorphae]|nr:MAG: phosphonate C-P lyase system protein PhnG [Mesorhizobium amorphae]